MMIKRQTTFTIIVDYEIEEGFDEFEEFHIAYNSLINDAVLDNLFIDDHYSEDAVL